MMKLRVEGMTCGHCAQAVTKAVEAVPAVDRAVVDLKAGEVAVEGRADETVVRAAIEKAGYAVPAGGVIRQPRRSGSRSGATSSR